MDFVLHHRRSAISVQDLLCQNSSETSSCFSPAPVSTPSSAAFSCPPLTLPDTTHTLSNDLTPTSLSDDDRRLHTSASSSPPPPTHSSPDHDHDNDNDRDLPAARSVRGPWRIDEDRLLIHLVSRYGPKHWSSIATHFPRRTGKQARERWINQLNPTLKKKNWTPAEDRTILRLHASLGNKWSAIANMLPGRTDNSVKNRYNSTLKRAMKERGLTPNSFDIDAFVQNLHARHFIINALSHNTELQHYHSAHSLHDAHHAPQDHYTQHPPPLRVAVNNDTTSNPAGHSHLHPFRHQSSHAYPPGSPHMPRAADIRHAPSDPSTRLPTFQEMLENAAPSHPSHLDRVAAHDFREGSPCTLTHPPAAPEISKHNGSAASAQLWRPDPHRPVLRPTDNLHNRGDALSPGKVIAKRRHLRS